MAQLSPDTAKPMGKADTPVPPTARRRIAIVAEDDRELRELVSSVLAYDDFTVREVGDGLELVQAVLETHAAHGKLDLIVTDVDMPHQDGLTAIAAMGGTRLGVPIVVITAFASDAARVQALQLGASAVLSKPFGLEQLRVLAAELTRDRGKVN